MKEELTIYNFKELLSLKDALVYTRKITNRIGEKNVLVGTDIFTIKYSLKKGDVIGLFYNGRILRLKKNKINDLLNTYGIKLDLEATEADYEEKEGYTDNSKESFTIDELAYLPGTTMLKEITIKKRKYKICLVVVNGNEVRYVYDKETKELCKLEVNGKEEEITREKLDNLRKKFTPTVKEGEKIVVVQLSNVPFLQEHSIFKQVNSDPNILKGYSVIGKNIIKFLYNKTTKEISNLIINNQPISLTEKNVKNLNIAIDAIAKALKIKSNLYTIDDINSLEENSTIRRIDDNKLEGFAYYGDDIVIRYIFDKKKRLLQELEINGKIVPINAHIIKYLNTSIADFQNQGIKKQI